MDKFDAALIESVARILGETEGGLTGAEIGRILSQLAIEDPLVAAEAKVPTGHYVRLSKKDRIRQALIDEQRRSGIGDCLRRFVEAAMAPVLYVTRHEALHSRTAQLNEVLSSVALELRPDGHIAKLVEAAKTVDEMVAKAGVLTSELRRRKCHPQVIKYCRVELLRKSNFHAAEEAVKGIFDRLREETGSTLDGGELIDQVFAFRDGIPVLALSRLSSKSEQSEQSGFMNVLKGLYGMYRNTLTHDTRSRRDDERPISDEELLGLLTTLSLIHEHLDRCQRTRTL
jgi:uncharacterized protein (TIGR02391 family)